MLNQNALTHQNLSDVFAPGKLDPGYHAPLINDLLRFCEEAGVSPRDVTGADYALTEFELHYLKHFNTTVQNGGAGLIYVGAHVPPVQPRMKSLCGAFLRNYRSARFMFRDELVYELWDRKRYPKFDIICVPDFAVNGLNDAPKRAVAAWLSRRVARGEQTALGVSTKNTFNDFLGTDAQHIMQHFSVETGVTQTAA